MSPLWPIIEPSVTTLPGIHLCKKILLSKYNACKTKALPPSRGQTIVSKTDKKPLNDQTPREGAYLLMSPVHIPPTMDDASVWLSSSSLELITVIDHENYRCSWRYVSL